MIRAHFGLDQNPFSRDGVSLLPLQQEILDTLRVHCQQGGLCVIVGEPGTGKSVVKQGDRTRCVDLKQVNRVLLQPHWRHQREQDE